MKKTTTVDPVGVREIAERFGVGQTTVTQWRQRANHGHYGIPFPEPRWIVSGHDAWDWSDIEKWANVARRGVGRPRVTEA